MKLAVSKRAVIHADDRGTISEAGTSVAGGGYIRTTEVTADPSVTERVRRGDHEHTGPENFVCIQAGSDDGLCATLYTAPSSNPTYVTSQNLFVGDLVSIPAGVIHTFMMVPGAKLLAVTDAPFSKAFTIEYRPKLDLARAVAV